MQNAWRQVSKTIANQNTGVIQHKDLAESRKVGLKMNNQLEIKSYDIWSGFYVLTTGSVTAK